VGELAAVFDQDGRRHVGELQMAQVLLPPGQVRARGAAVTLLRELLLEITVDRLRERSPAGFDAAEGAGPRSCPLRSSWPSARRGAAWESSRCEWGSRSFGPERETARRVRGSSALPRPTWRERKLLYTGVPKLCHVPQWFRGNERNTLKDNN
jgi:hypothetical protein